MYVLIFSISRSNRACLNINPDSRLTTPIGFVHTYQMTDKYLLKIHRRWLFGLFVINSEQQPLLREHNRRLSHIELVWQTVVTFSVALEWRKIAPDGIDLSDDMRWWDERRLESRWNIFVSHLAKCVFFQSTTAAFTLSFLKSSCYHLESC